MPTLTLGVGFENDEKIPVQKSHPYRVGGLFRHLGQVQGFQKLQFGPFGLLFKLSECVMPSNAGPRMKGLAFIVLPLIERPPN